MTLSEMSGKMSNAEFELWLALAAKQQNECPHCGHEAKDLMEVEIVKMHCPVCKEDYNRSTPIGQLRDMETSSMDIDDLVDD